MTMWIFTRKTNCYDVLPATNTGFDIIELYEVALHEWCYNRSEFFRQVKSHEQVNSTIDYGIVNELAT